MELLDRCASDLDLSLLIRFRIELGENFVCFFFICESSVLDAIALPSWTEVFYYPCINKVSSTNGTLS